MDDGQQAHAKYDFLYEEAVLDDAVRRSHPSVIEEEPGEHAADKPEDEGEVVHRHRFESHLEYEPKDQHGDGRLDEGPQESKIGADIPLLEVFFYQGPEECAVLP